MPPSWIPGLVLEERHHDEDDLLNDVDEDDDHHGVDAYVFNVWNCANANYTNVGDDVIHVVLKMPILQIRAIDGNIGCEKLFIGRTTVAPRWRGEDPTTIK